MCVNEKASHNGTRRIWVECSDTAMGLTEMDKRIYSGPFAFTYPETRMAFYPFWTKEEMETQMVLISGKSPEIRRIQGFKSIRVEMTLSNKADIQSKS